MNPLKALWMGGTVGYLFGRNLAFRHAPRVANGLMRLTNVSGRGRGRDGSAAADYFRAVVEDYEQVATLAGVVAAPGELFARRRVLELGPGNTRAVALLARLRGATSVAGCDAFDVQSRDEAYLRAVYEPLLAHAGEPGGYARAAALVADTAVHPDPARLARAASPFDLVISRAVLEHVRDLDGLYRGLRAATTADAVLIHKVDLRCHGFRLDHELDFLMIPDGVYRAVTTHLGEPNRVRLAGYLEVGARHGFTLAWGATTHTLPREAVLAVQDRLAAPFRALPVEELAVLGMWLVQVREDHPLAPRTPLAPGALGPAPVHLLSRY